MYVEKIKILIKQPTNQLEFHSFISEYRNVLKSSYIIGFPSHSDATKNYWKQRKFHVDRKHFITNRNHIKYTSSRLKKTEQLGANTNKIKQNSQHPPPPENSHEWLWSQWMSESENRTLEVATTNHSCCVGRGSHAGTLPNLNTGRGGRGRTWGWQCFLWLN